MTNETNKNADDYFVQQPYETLQQRMIREELEKGDPNGWVHDMEKEWEKFERDCED